MGQFLCIGIYTKVCASRKDAEYQYHSIEENRRYMVKSFNLDESLYDFHEDEEDIYFTIKPEALAHDLVPLLKRFYAMRYSKSHEHDSGEALKAVESCKDANAIQDLLKNKTFQTFQEGFHYDYVEATRTIGGMLVTVKSIILSLDGKIIMECYGELFRFFTRLIQEKLSDIPLAKALRVYIDG